MSSDWQNNSYTKNLGNKLFTTKYGSIVSCSSSETRDSVRKPYLELAFPKSEFSMSTNFFKGTRVVLKADPEKRGTLLDSTHVHSFCSKHNGAPKHIVQMDWSSSLLLAFLKFIGIVWLFRHCCRPAYYFNFFQNVANLVHRLIGRLRLVCIHDMEEESVAKRRKIVKLGIQGYNNSCYLDALLFSMFYASDAFDSILLEGQNTNQGKASSEINEEILRVANETRRLLKHDIVFPLRINDYVSYEPVWKFRKLLSPLCPRITGSFMAIEDIVYLLFKRVFDVPEFINYFIGCPNDPEVEIHSDFMHIMRVTVREAFPVITIQKSFEDSMRLNENMTFRKVPFPALIIGLPRNSGKLSHYDAIIPTFQLDIGGLMSIPDERCSKCNERHAVWELVNSNNDHHDMTTELKFLCKECIAELNEQIYSKSYVSRKAMTLSSVMCYRNSHFTTFVRKSRSTTTGYDGHTQRFCQLGSKGQRDNIWLRFDSMAGLSPEIVISENLEESVISLTEGIKKGDRLSFGMDSQTKAFCHDAQTCIYEPIFYNSDKSNVNEEQSKS